MNSVLTPNMRAWMCASEATGVGPLIDDAGLALALQGVRCDSQTFFNSISAGIHPNEASLLIFSYLLQKIGGVSETFPLNGDYENVILDYISIFDEVIENTSEPSNKLYFSRHFDPHPNIQLRLETEFWSDTWWTSPTYVNSNGASLPDIFCVSRRFSSKNTIIGGMVHGDILKEDAPNFIIDETSKNTPFPSDLVTEIPARPSNEESHLRIDSGQDFVDIVNNFPKLINAPQDNIAVIPNWKAIAREYHSVSISSRAYFQYSWIPLDTANGTTWLSNWVPEAIYLLR